MLKIIKSLFRKKEEYKRKDKLKVKSDTLFKRFKDCKEVIVTPAMFLTIEDIGEIYYYFTVKCNTPKDWQDRDLRHPANEDRLYIKKTAFKEANYRIIN